jgi:hypothetical protein
MSISRTAVVAAAIFASSPAFAGDTLFGGESVKQNQGYVEAGFPFLEGGVRLSMSDKFELRPFFQFSYGGFGGIGLGVGVIGLNPGVGIRYQLLDTGNLHGSLAFQLMVSMNFGTGGFGAPGGFIFGLGLGNPAWMMDYEVIPDTLYIDWGIRFEPFLAFGGGGAQFFGFIPLIVGIEGQVTDTVQLGFRLEGGPAFGTFGGFGVGVTGGVRAIVSAGFRF